MGVGNLVKGQLVKNFYKFNKRVSDKSKEGINFIFDHLSDEIRPE